MGEIGFVLGTASKDHQKVLVDQIVEQMEKAPKNDSFFYIVPNHIKFQTEIEVLDMLRKRRGKTADDRFATTRVQILSLSRLAWYLLRDTATLQKPRLSKIGLTMLVAKVVQEHADELQLYASEAKQQGFIQKLTDQLNQLAGSNISADDLTEIIKKAKGDDKVNQSWLAKMHDVELIYHAYEDRVNGEYLGNAALFHELTNFLETDESVAGMHFFLDRFAQFTPGEQEVVEAMIKNAASTSVSLVLDKAYPDSKLPDDNDLFYPSAMQYHRLWKFANNEDGVEIVANDLMAQEDRVSSALTKVDEIFAKYIKAPLDGNTVELDADEQEQLQFFTAGNRRAELERVATMIHKMVATQGYRYRDFLILTRKLAGYQTMIAPVFAANNIPIFNDHERFMGDHPLATLISTLFKLPLYGYRTEDIMQLLKTWLFAVQSEATGDFNALDADAVFVTENWCLKKGINGKSMWKKEKYWTVEDKRQSVSTDGDLEQRQQELAGKLHAVQGFVVDHIFPFFDQLKKAKTGRDLAEILYKFLVDNGVTKRLKDWQEYQASRDIDLAQQPHQVWVKFCQILDEYVQILGDSPVGQESFAQDMTNFSDLIQAGFASATYSQIPATLDQVMISETGITQNQDRKVVFLIGSTSDVMPQMSQAETLFTDQDKEILVEFIDKDTQYIPTGAIEVMKAEPLIHYSGMLAGTEKLIMSAPMSDEEEKEQNVSDYMLDLAKKFGKNIDKVTDPFSGESAMDFVSTPEATLSQYVRVLRKAKDENVPLSADWNKIYKELEKGASDEGFQKRLALVNAGFGYKNQVENLSPELAAELYLTHDHGQNVLRSSISQLESYYANPYKFFLEYGLKLKKRDELSMSPDRMGTFFHRVMEIFVNKVNGNSQISFEKLADGYDENQPVINQILDSAIQEATNGQPDLANLIQNSSQSAFWYGQLKELVNRMTNLLCWQAQYTQSRPTDTEIQFGRIGNKRDNDLFAIDLPLKDHNAHLKVNGRIDRLDVTDVDGKKYLNVVDYKSRYTRFDLTKAVNGISLQLLTYLNALEFNMDLLVPKYGNQSGDLHLGGAAYLQLQNPKLEFDKINGADPDLTEIGMKKSKYTGILLNDVAYLKAMDKKVNGKGGTVFPLKTKDGGKAMEGQKGTKLYTEQKLLLLLKKNEDLISNAANSILNGDVAIRPYRYLDGSNLSTGLEYSDYEDIIQFDNMVDQRNYRRISTVDENEMFLDLREKFGKKGEVDNGGN
ncbi:MAG: PD-(D/E)XK nuclease family protein [Limosilactobacillus sp.]|uniref:PD-(D/E)XK nuclease family protein n=1 Tax=Limosilactobacillus sp. TaxID=2773925 RepID=UPI0027112EB0|nr:PD-(D/E)XK nuclease family protein [Limosilactobacillus sp.]